MTVDEVMQRFKNRLHDTRIILTKLTSEDYKIWMIADEDYVLVWIYHQRDKESLNVKISKKLESNKIVTMIADLLDQLSKQSDYVYKVFLNNLFTSHKLLLYLRKRDYEVIDTARSNFEIYKKFVQLKTQDKKRNKILWKELKMMIISDNQIMQFVWKDNAIILFQLTMFDDQIYIIRDRKRSSKTSISAKTARALFNDKSHAMLLILNFDDVYNHYMKAVNQTDQLRAFYAYNHRCRSEEHKILYEFLIEISMINVYKLSLHSKISKKTKYTVHSEFRTTLTTDLIQISERWFLKRKKTSIESAIERSMIRLDDHQICRRKSLEDCRECKKIDRTVRSKNRQVLDEITSNLDDSEREKRSIFDCDICDISLCRDDSCWAAYHNSIWIASIKLVQNNILWFLLIN